MTDRFLARAAGGPLLLDAAMGTRLIARGLDLAADDPCLWALADPDAVGDVHRRDVAAGAEVLTTNTFGANRAWLGRFGRAGSVAAINRRAVQLARDAAGPDRFVMGSIGPTAVADAAAFREQADLLLDAGVDALVLETFRLDQALAALADRPGGPGDAGSTPILVGLFDWPEPHAAAADRLRQAGAAIVGANCFADMAIADRLLDALAAGPGRPVWLKPATGWPDHATPAPADFGRLAARIARIGAGLLGGCCGTTEAHLRAIRAAWDG